MRRFPSLPFCFGLLFLVVIPCQATEVRLSAHALERTLRNQLFTVLTLEAPDEPRYYLRGAAGSPCFVFAESPRVSLREGRVFVHVRTHSRVGTPLRGVCLGVTLTTEAEVSFIPVAEGESLGFRDARVEHLSESRELNFLLVPFLSHKLPAQMSLNAADLMRRVLARSPEQAGYTINLHSLRLHSMLVQDGYLLVDLDTNVDVD